MTVPSALLMSLLFCAAPPTRPFSILVVDEQTKRGVPLVGMITVNGIRLWTDSAGLAVFDEPGFSGQSVFFHVASHGYEFPRDGFGFRGKALKVVPGTTAKVGIRRINIAERLYRITGAGIYRDSVLAGKLAPIEEPLLNSKVLGSDSVVNAVYRGKVFWFWGDTNRPGYPLGNYHVPGATSKLPGKGGLDPEVGVNLTYFQDKTGFAKATAEMPGKGPTWLTSLVVLPDEKKVERLYAVYVKVKPPLALYARGLAVFDDGKQKFAHLSSFDFSSSAYPDGHAFRHRDKGTDFLYFANPFPLTRVKANLEAFRRPASYETFTCLKEGSRLDRPVLDRDSKGKLRYAWKKNTPAVGPAAQAKLIAAGKLKPSEALLQLRDRDTGKAVQAHSGSVYWNPHRKRWVLIAVELGGSSLLGEVWYAESDTPTGPWVYAVKVATHDRYSFYNPRHQPMFDKDGGRVIFFEGTYSHTFSGNPDATPRYDYNQILYKLDLDDPRLRLPVAVYDLSGTKSRIPLGTIHAKGWKSEVPIAFFAHDRPMKGLVPIRASAKAEPMFYALAAEAKGPPKTTVPLYEYVSEGGGMYSTSADWKRPGYKRSERPVGRVWSNPRAAGQQER
jgi:hypothetical protein